MASGQILHVGNILNNGYLHCKYLRKRGVLSDSLNVDYRHCQGQPEWAEVDIRQSVADWDQDWKEIDLKGFVRPDWFHDVTLAELGNLGQTAFADIAVLEIAEGDFGLTDNGSGNRVLRTDKRIVCGQANS